MVELRCCGVFVGMVVSGRGAPRCRNSVGRRSRFNPCTPGWFGVGRLACGLFTVMWRLQLWCGWCAVVAAASWSVAWRQSHGFIRGLGRRRAWHTTVSPTRWTPFPFGPVHAWLVSCWPACVWSVYGQVAAAAAVWSVRGCLGHLMVGLVCMGFVALLPVVVSLNVVCAAGTSVSALASCVLLGPSAA